MTGASHHNSSAFYRGLGSVIALLLAVSLAVIGGPVAARPAAQVATATVTPGGATGTLTTTRTTAPTTAVITATGAPGGATGTLTTTRTTAPTTAVITATGAPSGATGTLTTTRTTAPTGTVAPEQRVSPTAATGTPVAADAAPAAVRTGVPPAVGTGAAGAVPTSGAAPIAPAAGAGQPNVAPVPTPGDTGGGQGALLPWLVGALVLAGLAGTAFFALRPKTAVAPPLAPVVTPTVSQTVATTVEPATAQLGTAAIRCPNCDTLNPPDRRFCDECGQDLRVGGVGVPTTTLPPLDEASTPYLETLSRVDEQLEFVLARNTVTLGRATDNDVVIDDRFMGWQTVSPHHARLTRQGDGFVIADLQSDNGTFVNSARTGQNVLEDGMTVALGKVEFVYRVPPA